jgi:hypothetical protein
LPPLFVELALGTVHANNIFIQFEIVEGNSPTVQGQLFWLVIELDVFLDVFHQQN